MLRKLVAFATLAVMLSGCATTSTQPILASDRAKVTSVTLSEEVPVPPQMSYLGPGGATAFVFGAVGGALAAPGIEKERQAFQAQVGGGTSIGRIVYDETRSQFRRTRSLPLRDAPASGGATLQVTVTNYGFSIPHGFSSKLVPILGIRYELRDESGRVLWSASDRTMPLGNPVEAVDAAEIMANPAAREAAWRGAARALAAKLAASY